ncbi:MULTISPECIES: RNA polymerase factor sigma-54 [unclassified Roseateles]|uniref:RNA polymerase factor sigma-54 n=1 Tax=unclassified Roseateles TaxID=2626991 RepID=UPI000700924B|nr:MULTISPECIES: RNA polymerase factor sigma-54 [unclassified Roseateles]KQW52026.1 RNA polymerase sigma-54 factor [Pelomonas sp. Root405]KRA78260.1 RNA polymerase sigma-54 factor [Pelomonas sp. Root662]
MPSMDLRADHRQTQTLSPRLQHAVRLLQMSSLDFAAMLRETLGKNPFLEVEDNDGGDGGDAGEAALPLAALQDGGADAGVLASVAANDANAELVDTSSDDLASPMDGADNGENDRDLWAADGGSGLKRAEDGELSALDMMAVEASLTAHLHTQLNVMPLSERDLAMARTIVESLDDDGYLRTPLEELISVARLDPAPDLQEMQIALKLVQSLDPAGVAARDVAECLLLQLPGITCPDTRTLAQTIVTNHLSALAARDVSSLARQLGEPPARVEAVCDRIRRLDPRPGWRFGSSHVAYVVPDVIVKKVRGQWTVQLNPAIVPKVRLNQVYAKLFARHRTPANAELGAHLQEARWTLRNVEQRFSTILDVAEAIVRRQHNFLDYGPMAMKPLGLKEIAEEVGIHESTVSRVTNNKYMSTPVGVLELKYFFSRAMISANGSACSGTAIRGLIKDIIEAESADAPLSDAEITRQLAQQGLVVARRTVTKYRQMLKIEAVDRRRRVA